MRYIIFVIDTQTASASTAEMAAINAFNESLVSAGHFVLAAGISQVGLLVDNRDGRCSVDHHSLQHDGEAYSGFWLIDALDDKTAELLALAASKSCNRRVELRAFLY
jgi:hypothetical protein